MTSRTDNRIPSGFPMLDMLTGGGYPKGSVTVIRLNGAEYEAEIVQDFMQRQALNYALPNNGKNLKTLLATLQMTQEDACQSICYSRYEKADTLMKASLAIWGRDMNVPLPDPGEFAAFLAETIQENGIEALIVDAIDELIPKKNGEERENISRMLVEDLTELAEEHGIPVIVTDYQGTWRAYNQIHPDIVELDLNSDVNGTVQCVYRENKNNTTIENLYGIPEHPGLELVRSVLASGETVPDFQTADQVSILAHWAATIIRQMELLLNTGQQ